MKITLNKDRPLQSLGCWHFCATAMNVHLGKGRTLCAFPAPRSLWPLCEKRLRHHMFEESAVLTLCSHRMSILACNAVRVILPPLVLSPLPLLGPPSFILSGTKTRKLSSHLPTHHLWPLETQLWYPFLGKGKKRRFYPNNFFFFISNIIILPWCILLRLIPAFKIIKCEEHRDYLFHLFVLSVV